MIRLIGVTCTHSNVLSGDVLMIRSPMGKCEDRVRTVFVCVVQV